MAVSSSIVTSGATFTGTGTKDLVRTGATGASEFVHIVCRNNGGLSAVLNVYLNGTAAANLMAAISLLSQEVAIIEEKLGAAETIHIEAVTTSTVNYSVVVDSLT